MSQPPISREGFREFLGELQDHLIQLREEGTRAVEIDPALVKNLSRPPAATPVPAAPAAPAVTAGPERWVLAVRDDAVAGRVVWRICADGASYAGEAGALLRSILSAAGFTLSGEPSAAIPASGYALSIAFGMRAFQAACANPRALFDRQRGQVIDTPSGKLVGTYAPPDLLPNNVPLKKVVWADVKAAMAACGIGAR
jgi:hypothetical protein